MKHETDFARTATALPAIYRRVRIASAVGLVAAAIAFVAVPGRVLAQLAWSAF